MSAKSKRTQVRGHLLTGAELRFAAKNGNPVFYEEHYHNPDDRGKHFKGDAMLQKAMGAVYYIGNSDIDLDEFKDDQLVTGEFPEGTFSVFAVVGVSYADP